LWTELKRLRVPAERQDFVQVNRRRYALDFAVYCAMGKLDIETDGDTWHANPRRAAADNVRDNDLETAGWKLLRFTTHQVTEQMNEYCLPTIVDNLNRLGAWNDGQTAPRRLHLVDTRAEYRLGLSDRPGGR